METMADFRDRGREGDYIYIISAGPEMGPVRYLTGDSPGFVYSLTSLPVSKRQVINPSNYTGNWCADLKQTLNGRCDSGTYRCR